MAGDRFCERAARTCRDHGASWRVPGLRAPLSPDGDGWCPSAGTPARRTEHVEITLDGTGAAVSDRGHVRARNEDAVALRPRRCRRAAVAAVVCDGVSSMRSSRARRPGGRRRRARRPAARHRQGSGCTRSAVAAAAAAAARARAARHPDAAVVHAGVRRCTTWRTGVLIVGWVGDSRAYWLARAGRRRARTPADRRPHRGGRRRSRHAGPGASPPPGPTRSPGGSGADGDAEPDVVAFTPAGPGALLLCTDGLWKYLPGRRRAGRRSPCPPCRAAARRPPPPRSPRPR